MTSSTPAQPGAWTEFKLGELLKLSNGINADRFFYGSGVPFANVLEIINNESVEEKDVPGRIDLPRKVLARYEVRRGDFLFNRTSETQEEVGLASVYLGSQPIVFGGFVLRGRPLTNRLDLGYSKYALRSAAVRSQIIARGQGGIRANIGQRDLRTVIVTLPDIPEQRAIAEVLNDASRHIELLKCLIIKRQSIKQGVLQQLLTGRTRLPNFTEPWKEASLSDIAAVNPETLTSRVDPRMVIDYISLEDVERGEIFGCTTVTFGTAPSRARRVVRSRDVLFGTVRPNLQSHALYGGGLSHPIASTGFAVVRGSEEADPQFIFNLLMSHLTSTQVDRIIAGSNYPAVTSMDVRRLTFIVPSKDEQRAIGSVLADSDRELADLKRRLYKAKSIKQGIMQQLLTGRTRLPARGIAS